MSLIELQPCPECGAAAEWDTSSNIKPSERVKCSDWRECDLRGPAVRFVDGMTDRSHTQAAADKWNLLANRVDAGKDFGALVGSFKGPVSRERYVSLRGEAS